MGVTLTDLTRDLDKEGRGWAIQKGLQHSNGFNGMDIKHIVIETINVGKSRGEHYHKKKTEWFLALTGKADLFWREITKMEVTREVLDADCPKLMRVDPNTCHKIVNNYSEDFLIAAFLSEEDTSDKEDCRTVLVP